MANVFDLQIFDNETTALLILKFAWKSVLLFHLLLFFLNDRNIVTSLSTIHFKCWSIPKTVWHFQKKKTFLQSNFLKICLEQFKLSGHVELEKWNMFAFSNLQFEQKRWLKLKNYTFFQFGWKSGYKIYYFS